MAIFHGKYRNDETGGPHIDPKILLKVVLLAYSLGAGLLPGKSNKPAGMWFSSL